MGNLDKQKFQLILFEAGKLLEHPPRAKNKLLQTLEKVEACLYIVNPPASKSMLSAMRPSVNYLVNPGLMRHRDKDVKLLVLHCLSRITKLTAPTQPYIDDMMKEILELIVGCFQELGVMHNPSFKRRVSILKTVAEVKLCRIMLDLELNDLLLEMFQHFFSNVSQNLYSADVHDSMKNIMCLVLDESDDIWQELLSVLLINLKREMKDSAPAAHSLSLNVVASCAEKLRPYLRAKLSSNQAIICNCQHGYDEIVHDTCLHGREDINANEHATASQEVILLERSCNSEPDASSEDDANSLFASSQLNPDHHYNELTGDENEADNKLASSSERGQGFTTGIIGLEIEPSNVSLTEYIASESNSNLAASKSLKRTRLPRNRGRKKRVSAVQTTVEGNGEDEKLVGRKIKVWWPADKEFYEGVVESYNPKTKKHAILYFDGDREELKLSRQRWDFIDRIPRLEYLR